MKTDVKKLEGNVVEVNIEIDAKKAAAEYDIACKRLAERVNIAGFRKGKAPKNIIEKHVGIDTIQRNALEAILPKVFTEVIRTNNLDIVAEPYIESFSFEDKQPLKITAKFELRPEITISAYKGLEVKAEEFKQSENALEDELNKIAEKYSELKTVQKDKAEASDLVVIDFEGFVNGEPIKGGAANGYTLDLGNSNFIKGFAEAIVGNPVGEEFTINVSFPDNYHDEKLKGAPAEFKIKIIEIKEKTTPALDDALAQKVSQFKTIDELKADIQKYLDNVLKGENDRRAYDAVFNKVLENTKIDIQESMITREAQALLRDMEARVKQQGGDFEKVIEAEGKDKVWNELKAEAQKRIKNTLVITKIAQDEKIQVNANDLETKINEVAMMYGVDKQTMVGELQKNAQLIQSLSQQIINEKITKFLLENNTVKFGKK